jgi:hypothetical protein
VKEGPRKATVDEVVDELARHAREEEEKKQRAKPPRVSPAEDALRARLVEFLTAEPPARPVSSRPSAGSYSERPPEVESPPPRKPSSKPPVVTAQSKRPSVGSYSERPPEVESPPPPKPSSKPPAMAAPSKRPPRVSGGYTTLPPDEVITVTSRPPRGESAVSKPPPPSASRAPAARKEPVLVLTATIAAIMKEEGLDPRAGYILSFVDGAQTADEVVGACGLPADQVNAVIDELLLRRLIARK